MNRLTSTDHIYSLCLALCATLPSRGGSPLLAKGLELVLLFLVSEAVLLVVGGLRKNAMDDPRSPIAMRQVLGVAVSIVVVILIGGFLFNIM